MNKQFTKIENPAYEEAYREWEHLNERAMSMQNNDHSCWELDAAWNKVKFAKSILDRTPRYIHVEQ